MSSLLVRTSLRTTLRNVRFLRHATKVGTTAPDDKASLVKKQETRISGNSDILLDSIKSVHSAKTVLEMVRMHGNVMTSKHLMQALRSIFMLQKSGSSALSMQRIIENRDFELLCRQLKKQAGTIDLHETIEALKIISFVGVASDSTIIQVLLNLLKHQLNDFGLHQLIFFDFLIGQMKPTPLIDAMQIAIPLVFEIQLPYKNDPHNIVYMTEFLQYMSKKTVSARSIEFLVNTIMEYRDEIDVAQAKSIAWSLCDFLPNEFFEPLLKRALNVLSLQIEGLAPDDIPILLSKLCTRNSKRYPFYYNQTFFDLCANYTIDKGMDFEYVVKVLRQFGRVSYSNHHLLDYASKLISEDPEILNNSEIHEIYTFILSISLTDYRPQYWNHIKTLIEKTDRFNVDINRDILWLKLAVSLFALDIFKVEVLQNALSPRHLEKIIKKSLYSDFENLLLIKQLVTLFKPDYMHLLPTDLYMHEIANRLKYSNEYPLRNALHVALGGENYVKTGVTTELQQHIDHLIVMRKGGYPVAFTKDSNRLEDIEITADNQTVVVLGLNHLAFPINNNAQKSTTSLFIKTLEAKNCIVVPISLTDWTALLDHERIPYLMRAIKTKLQEHEQATDFV